MTLPFIILTIVLSSSSLSSALSSIVESKDDEVPPLPERGSVAFVGVVVVRGVRWLLMIIPSSLSDEADVDDTMSDPLLPLTHLEKS